MTVRVNKQPFNIREKLSELERPIGVKGNELMRAETAQDARDLVSAGRKNMIINGAMLISQRYSTAQSMPSGTQPYFVDRFNNRNNSDKCIRSHSSEAPDGFYRSMKMKLQVTDILASNQYLRFQQYIEGHNNLLKCAWGIQNTDYLTLSFWVKSSVPGKYYVNLEDGDAIPLYLKPYYINQADTWQKVELFPPPPSGTFRQHLQIMEEE